MLKIGDLIADFRIFKGADRLTVGTIEEEFEAQRIIMVEQIAIRGAADLEIMTDGSCADSTFLGCRLRFGQRDLHVGDIALATDDIFRPAKPHPKEFARCLHHRRIMFPLQTCVSQGVAKITDLPFIFLWHVGPITSNCRQYPIFGAGYDFKRSRVRGIVLIIIIVRGP